MSSWPLLLQPKSLHHTERLAECRSYGSKTGKRQLHCVWEKVTPRQSATEGCLFGLAVECATARLSTWTGLICCTKPGTNPARGAKLGQAHML